MWPRRNPLSRLANPTEVTRYVDQVAHHRGWKVNPDQDFVAPILEGLATQAARFGKPYCPCRDADGGETDRDIVCPCVYAQPDIEGTGQCFCGLFLAISKDPHTVTSIPERRP